MKVLEVLKKGFLAAYSNLNIVLGIFAFNFVIALLSIPLRTRMPIQVPGEPPVLPPGGIVAGFWILNIVAMLVGIFIYGGALNFLKKFIKEGAAAIQDFIEGGKKFYLKLLGIGLLVGAYLLVLFAVAAVVVGLTIVPTGGNMNPVAMLEIIIFSILGVVGLLFITFAPYGVVIKESKVFEAFGASLKLVAKFFLKVAGLFLLLFGVGFGAGRIAGFIAGLLRAIPVLSGLIGGVLTSAINAFMLMVGAAAYMIMYFALTEGAAEEFKPGPVEPPAAPSGEAGGA